MDTHKEPHRVAFVYPDSGEIQEFAVKNAGKHIAKMVRQIRKRSTGQVNSCYEAGSVDSPSSVKSGISSMHGMQRGPPSAINRSRRALGTPGALK